VVGGLKGASRVVQPIVRYANTRNTNKRFDTSSEKVTELQDSLAEPASLFKEVAKEQYLESVEFETYRRIERTSRLNEEGRSSEDLNVDFAVNPQKYSLVREQIVFEELARKYDPKTNSVPEVDLTSTQLDILRQNQRKVQELDLKGAEYDYLYTHEQYRTTLGKDEAEPPGQIISKLDQFKEAENRYIEEVYKDYQAKLILGEKAQVYDSSFEKSIAAKELSDKLEIATIKRDIYENDVKKTEDNLELAKKENMPTSEMEAELNQKKTDLREHEIAFLDAYEAYTLSLKEVAKEQVSTGRITQEAFENTVKQNIADIAEISKLRNQQQKSEIIDTQILRNTDLTRLNRDTTIDDVFSSNTKSREVIDKAITEGYYRTENKDLKPLVNSLNKILSQGTKVKESYYESQGWEPYAARTNQLEVILDAVASTNKIYKENPASGKTSVTIPNLAVAKAKLTGKPVVVLFKSKSIGELTKEVGENYEFFTEQGLSVDRFSPKGSTRYDSISPTGRKITDPGKADITVSEIDMMFEFASNTKTSKDFVTRLKDSVLIADEAHQATKLSDRYVISDGLGIRIVDMANGKGIIDAGKKVFDIFETVTKRNPEFLTDGKLDFEKMGSFEAGKEFRMDERLEIDIYREMLNREGIDAKSMSSEQVKTEIDSILAENSKLQLQMNVLKQYDAVLGETADVHFGENGNLVVPLEKGVGSGKQYSLVSQIVTYQMLGRAKLEAAGNTKREVNWNELRIRKDSRMVTTQEAIVDTFSEIIGFSGTPELISGQFKRNLNIVTWNRARTDLVTKQDNNIEFKEAFSFEGVREIDLKQLPSSDLVKHRAHIVASELVSPKPFIETIKSQEIDISRQLNKGTDFFIIDSKTKLVTREIYDSTGKRLSKEEMSIADAYNLKLNALNSKNRIVRLYPKGAEEGVDLPFFGKKYDSKIVYADPIKTTFTSIEQAALRDRGKGILNIDGRWKEGEFASDYSNAYLFMKGTGSQSVRRSIENAKTNEIKQIKQNNLRGIEESIDYVIKKRIATLDASESIKERLLIQYDQAKEGNHGVNRNEYVSGEEYLNRKIARAEETIYDMIIGRGDFEGILLSPKAKESLNSIRGGSDLNLESGSRTGDSAIAKSDTLAELVRRIRETTGKDDLPLQVKSEPTQEPVKVQEAVKSAELSETQKAERIEDIKSISDRISADLYKENLGEKDFYGVVDKHGIDVLGIGGNSIVLKIPTRFEYVAVKFYFKVTDENLDVEKAALAKTETNPLFQQHITSEGVTESAFPYLSTEIIEGYGPKNMDWLSFSEQQKTDYFVRTMEHARSLPDEHLYQLAEMYYFAEQNGILLDISKPTNFIYNADGFKVIDFGETYKPRPLDSLKNDVTIIISGYYRNKEVDDYIIERMDKVIEQFKQDVNYVPPEVTVKKTREQLIEDAAMEVLGERTNELDFNVKGTTLEPPALTVALYYVRGAPENQFTENLQKNIPKDLMTELRIMRESLDSLDVNDPNLVENLRDTLKDNGVAISDNPSRIDYIQTVIGPNAIEQHVYLVSEILDTKGLELTNENIINEYNTVRGQTGALIFDNSDRPETPDPSISRRNFLKVLGATGILSGGAIATQNWWLPKLDKWLGIAPGREVGNIPAEPTDEAPSKKTPEEESPKEIAPPKLPEYTTTGNYLKGTSPQIKAANELWRQYDYIYDELQLRLEDEGFKELYIVPDVRWYDTDKQMAHQILESGYELDAKSTSNARGPLQVRPDAVHESLAYLAWLDEKGTIDLNLGIEITGEGRVLTSQAKGLGTNIYNLLDPKNSEGKKLSATERANLGRVLGKLYVASLSDPTYYKPYIKALNGAKTKQDQTTLLRTYNMGSSAYKTSESKLGPEAYWYPINFFNIESFIKKDRALLENAGIKADNYNYLVVKFVDYAMKRGKNPYTQNEKLIEDGLQKLKAANEHLERPLNVYEVKDLLPRWDEQPTKDRMVSMLGTNYANLIEDTQTEYDTSEYAEINSLYGEIAKKMDNWRFFFDATRPSDISSITDFNTVQGVTTEIVPGLGLLARLQYDGSKYTIEMDPDELSALLSNIQPEFHADVIKVILAHEYAEMYAREYDLESNRGSARPVGDYHMVAMWHEQEMVEWEQWGGFVKDIQKWDEPVRLTADDYLNYADVAKVREDYLAAQEHYDRATDYLIQRDEYYGALTVNFEARQSILMARDSFTPSGNLLSEIQLNKKQAEILSKLGRDKELHSVAITLGDSAWKLVRATEINAERNREQGNPVDTSLLKQQMLEYQDLLLTADKHIKNSAYTADNPELIKAISSARYAESVRITAGLVPSESGRLVEFEKSIKKRIHGKYGDRNYRVVRSDKLDSLSKEGYSFYWYVGRGEKDIRLGSYVGMAVVSIKPEFEHLYEYTLSDEERSVGDLFAKPKTGSLIPAEHIDFHVLDFDKGIAITPEVVVQKTSVVGQEIHVDTAIADELSIRNKAHAEIVSANVEALTPSKDSCRSGSVICSGAVETEVEDAVQMLADYGLNNENILSAMQERHDESPSEQTLEDIRSAQLRKIESRIDDLSIKNKLDGEYLTDSYDNMNILVDYHNSDQSFDSMKNAINGLKNNGVDFDTAFLAVGRSHNIRTALQSSVEKGYIEEEDIDKIIHKASGLGLESHIARSIFITDLMRGDILSEDDADMIEVAQVVHDIGKFGPDIDSEFSETIASLFELEYVHVNQKILPHIRMQFSDNPDKASNFLSLLDSNTYKPLSEFTKGQFSQLHGTWYDKNVNGIEMDERAKKIAKNHHLQFIVYNGYNDELYYKDIPDDNIHQLSWTISTIDDLEAATSRSRTVEGYYTKSSYTSSRITMTEGFHHASYEFENNIRAKFSYKYFPEMMSTVERQMTIQLPARIEELES